MRRLDITRVLAWSVVCGVALLACEVTDSTARGPLEPPAGDELDAGTPDGTDASEPPLRGRCAPGAPTSWLTEGETVRVTISCRTGLALEPTKFAVVNPPEGASWDAETATLEWEPRLDQAAVYHVEVSVPEFGESGTVRIGVADAFTDSDNVPVQDPATYTEEYGLPVFHLFPATELPRDKTYVPTKIVFRGHAYEGEAKLRGASSMRYAKKNFTLSFPDEDEFDDPATGLVNRDKLVLITTFDDLTGVRNRLAYELWNRMDERHVHMRTGSAVVMLDGKWWGLYTYGEHIDKDLAKRAGWGKEGNLFKAWSAYANWSLLAPDGERKDPVWYGFEKKDGLPLQGESGAFDDLVEVIRFVENASDDEFSRRLSEHVDVLDYMDWWILVVATLATDSTDKNSFHWHDPAYGPFRYVPWDFNASFGQNWDTVRVSPRRESEFGGENRLWERLLDDPAFDAQMRARFGRVVADKWPSQEVLDRFDALVAEIDPVARRDERRWLSAIRRHYGWSRDFDEDVAYTRNWLVERWKYLEKKYPAP